MKNLHIPTILVTLGLVGLVAILSGQNMVGSPRVTVNNPLGVPGWVPSGVWMARRGQDPATGSWIAFDYTVPAGHFALMMAENGGHYSKGYGGVEVDSGSGFYTLVTSSSPGGSFAPGIVVDEGVVIRASGGSGTSPTTVTGYLIPK